MSKYVRIRTTTSWHIVKTPTRMFDTYVTLCKRTITAGQRSDEFGDDKTCESCFRQQARQDAAT